jgi:hypothetical protein
MGRLSNGSETWWVEWRALTLLVTLPTLRAIRCIAQASDCEQGIESLMDHELATMVSISKTSGLNFRPAPAQRI